MIYLKDPNSHPSRPQYPISLKHRWDLKPLIDKLLHKGILRPTHSSLNTPILPVLKPDGSYRLVQDLRIINSAIIPTHPVVPNPYMLLSHITTNTTYFSVLKLKDAFFTIPFHPDCHNLFAFTWEDPASGLAQQLTWTVLSQGFWDSPHFFGQALAWDLSTLDLQPSTLFQNVDDLLLCSPTLTGFQNHTVLLLNFLAQQRYHVSPSKAQLSQPQVKYLSLLLTPTSRTIMVGHKAHIRSLMVPSTKGEVLSFRGLAGYVRSWIPNFALLAQPLYEAARGPITEPLDLAKPIKTPFLKLQQALLQAPALSLSQI
jgi:hypothetical protein